MSAYGMARTTGKGPYRHQWCKWKGGVAVSVADLCFRDTTDNYDKSAASFPFTTDLPTTQAAFRLAFRGVSEARRVVGQLADGDHASDGCILATGAFTFPCAPLGAAVYVSATSFVTLAKQTGNLLEPQKVVATTNPGIAIGKMTRDAAAGAVELTFELITATFTNPAA